MTEAPQALTPTALEPRKPIWGIILAFTAAKFALLLVASGNYNYFRDELYFIACGRHLDWGYVDHSPLVGVYARIGEMLGPSLRAFRFPATLAGSAHVLLTGVLTARLGGGLKAQALACAAVLLCPVYLAIGTLLSMNVFEHVYWLAAILVLVEIANGASERLWVVFGLLVGIGLQNKHSMVFFGMAVAIAIVATPLRRSLARPWIWIGAGTAFLVFLPNVLWQVAHGWPTLELLRNVKDSGKNIELGPIEFVLQQVMMLNPFSAPLWLAGLAGLLFWRPLRRNVFLGVTYLVRVVLFIALEAKDYYVAPIYALLFAAGATLLGEMKGRNRFLYPAVFAALVFGGAISLPLALPLASVDDYLAYQRWLGIKPRRNEVSHTSELPQRLSDQLGWEEMVAEVAKAYQSLPEDFRAKTGIFCSNYGQAGAIDFYGPKYGLPPAICGHQNYFYWGSHGHTGESLIVITDEMDDRGGVVQDIRIVGQRYHPLAIPEENGPIFHCRLARPLADVWPALKHWR